MRNNDFPEFEERLPQPAEDRTTQAVKAVHPMSPRVKKILNICCALLLIFSFGGAAYLLIGGKEERAVKRQLEKEEWLEQKVFEIRSKATRAVANKDRGAHQAAMAELQELTSKNQDIIEGQKKRIQAGQEAARQERVASEKRQLEGMIAGWTKQPPSKNAFFRQRWIQQNESRFSGFQPEVAALGREAMAKVLSGSSKPASEPVVADQPAAPTPPAATETAASSPKANPSKTKTPASSTYREFETLQDQIELEKIDSELNKRM